MRTLMQPPSSAHCDLCGGEQKTAQRKPEHVAAVDCAPEDKKA